VTMTSLSKFDGVRWIEGLDFMKQHTLLSAFAIEVS